MDVSSSTDRNVAGEIAFESHLRTYMELKREYDEATSKLLALKKEFGDSSDGKGQELISELEGTHALCTAAMQGAKSEIDMAQEWEYYQIDEEAAGKAVLLVLNTLEVLVDQLNTTTEYLVKRSAEVEMEKSMNELEESLRSSKGTASIASPEVETAVWSERNSGTPASETPRNVAPLPSPTFQSSPNILASPASPAGLHRAVGTVLTPGQLATPGQLVKEIGRLHLVIGEKDKAIQQLTEESEERSNMLSACSDEMMRLLEKYEALLAENMSMSEHLETLLSEKDPVAVSSPTSVPLPPSRQKSTRKKKASSPPKKETRKEKAGYKKGTRAHFFRFGSPAKECDVYKKRSGTHSPTNKLHHRIKHKREREQKQGKHGRRGVATKMPQGHFSYVVGGKKGADAKNPIVQYNRQRTKRPDYLKRKSVVMPQELLNAKGMLKRVAAQKKNNYRKRISIVIPKDLRTAKSKLKRLPTPHPKKKTKVPLDVQTAKRTLGQVESAEEAFRWLEKNGMKITDDQRRMMHHLGIDVSNAGDSPRQKKRMTSPVNKIIKKTQQITVKETKASRLRRASTFSKKVQKDYNAVSWRKSLVRGR